MKYLTRSVFVLLCALLLISFCGCQSSDNSDISNMNTSNGGNFASADAFEEPLPSPDSLGLSENTLKNHHYHSLTEEEQLLYIAVLNTWKNGEDSLKLKKYRI